MLACMLVRLFHLISEQKASILVGHKRDHTRTTLKLYIYIDSFCPSWKSPFNQPVEWDIHFFFHDSPGCFFFNRWPFFAQDSQRAEAALSKNFAFCHMAWIGFIVCLIVCLFDCLFVWLIVWLIVCLEHGFQAGLLSLSLLRKNW